MKEIIFIKTIVITIFLFLSANCYSGDFKDVKDFQDKLYNHNFTSLEQAISDVEKEYLASRSVENEAKLTFVYRVFQLDRLDAEEHFDKWIDQSPKSHIPYLARGIYKYKRAWVARGSKYMNKTTKEQIDGLRYFLLAAKKDLETASNLNSKTYIPYLYLMDSAKTGVLDRGSVDEYFNQGLEYAPKSYTLHLWYALNIRPRWGGSKEQWDNLLNEIEPKLLSAPHLKIVNGVMTSVSSGMAKKNGDLNQALKLIDQSIEFGPAADFYYSKFLILNKLKRKDAKLSLLDAEKIKPERVTYLTELSVIYQYEENWKACIDYASRSIYRGAETRGTYVTRGYCQERSGRLHKALLDYEYAINIDPSYKWAHSAIARIKDKLAAKS